MPSASAGAGGRGMGLRNCELRRARAAATCRGNAGNYGALGATPPTCLSTRSGHRDSPPAWRPPERAFPPTRPTSWTLPGVAIYGDLKVRAGGAPVGLGSSQGHGGSGWGVGCAWGSPLPAVVRVWAPGGAAGTWRRFPARPGAFSFPLSCCLRPLPFGGEAGAAGRGAGEAVRRRQTPSITRFAIASLGAQRQLRGNCSLEQRLISLSTPT